MIRSYDLLLQPPTQGPAHDSAATLAAFVAKGATARADGHHVLTFGRTEVELRPVKEAGLVVATEVKLQLGRETAFIAPLLALVMEVARAQKLRVIDPSQSKELVETDGASLEESYRRTAEYAGEFLGVGDALGRMADPVPEGLTRSGAAWLALAVFLAAAWLGWRFMIGR
jgi:hypothetical protein